MLRLRVSFALGANPNPVGDAIRKLSEATAKSVFSLPKSNSLQFSKNRFQYSRCQLIQWPCLRPFYSTHSSPPSAVRHLPLPRFSAPINRTPPFVSAPLPSMPFSSVSRPSGEIHVIIGPMFAGKTTALLRRIRSEEGDGRKVVVIKSSKDTRYAVDAVVTHDGARVPCWALPDLRSFKQKLGADAYSKVDVIGIDEAQFFEDLHEFCCEAADRDGKVVIVAGLDGDYLRRSFGCVMDIIPVADSVTKLTARCEVCGNRAFFTLRKTDDTRTELIAGADVYMPVCRTHYHAAPVAAKRDDVIYRVVGQ